MNFVPQLFLIQPNCDLADAVLLALEQGVRLFIVCGGDGTIDSVAALLAAPQAASLASAQILPGEPPLLAIIPTGTQNNVAFNLGIPTDISAALGLLKTGRKRWIDLGLAHSANGQRIFVEACSVGLLSALFPAADEIQRGNFPRLAEFLGTLMAFPVSEIDIAVDNLPVS